MDSLNEFGWYTMYIFFDESNILQQANGVYKNNICCKSSPVCLSAYKLLSFSHSFIFFFEFEEISRNFAIFILNKIKHKIRHQQAKPNLF